MLETADIDRFWDKVEKREPTECWPWLGDLVGDGYGRFRVRGKNVPAHRISLTLSEPAPPADKPFACHSCDNPPCCNPAHLWWGSNADNVRDSVAKGRHWNASRTHCPKGHPYSGANLYDGIDRNGHRRRQCVTCALEAFAQGQSSPESRESTPPSTQRWGGRIVSRAEEIAAGLSDLARKTVGQPFNLDGWCSQRGFEMAAEMQKAGLVTSYEFGGDEYTGIQFEPTPLGLEVRAALTEKPDPLNEESENG